VNIVLSFTPYLCELHNKTSVFSILYYWTLHVKYTFQGRHFLSCITPKLWVTWITRHNIILFPAMNIVRVQLNNKWIVPESHPCLDVTSKWLWICSCESTKGGQPVMATSNMATEGIQARLPTFSLCTNESMKGHISQTFLISSPFALTI